MIRSVFLLICLVPATGFALSFSELSNLSYEASIAKAQADGKHRSLMFEKEAAGAYEPLNLEGNARRIRSSEPMGDGMEYGLMLGINVKNPRYKEALLSQYDAALVTLEDEQKLRRGLLECELKRELLLKQLGEEIISVAAQKLVSAESAYTIALKKYQAGRMSQMELVRFETESSIAQKELDALKREIEAHENALRILSGSTAKIAVDDMPFGYLDARDAEGRIDRSVILTGYDSAYAELTRAIETLRHSRFESVGVGAGVTREVMQNSLDLRLIVPIASANRNEKKIASLMAQQSALARQKQIAKEKLRNAVLLGSERLERIRSDIERSMALEERYSALYRMAEKGFEGGVVGQFEYLETKNRYYGARADTLRMKQGYVEEMAKIEEKMGGVWK